ncbi:TPA: hypothetical protein DCZ39_06285 [Patescibacteria group bacterium]|nr:hypothetical protein [Candidatus Gracilibacteria bacterium]
MVNDPFKLQFTQALSSTLQGRSINPRGALYAFTNCPCLMVCPRGVLQLALLGNGLCFIAGCVVTGEFVVPRISIGFSVVFIFPCVSNSAHTFIGVVG